MTDIVIEVENLSKLYRLGTIGTGSFRQDLQQWWNTAVLKKQDLFFQTQETNVPDVKNQFLWALRNVSFQMNRGDVLGIIGSNGSGKSTLLKIISRIVQPTQGRVRGKGKVNSLLEVGTGFHQDLTGRDNIYISGYTLGMHKNEIKKKFDEIVAFSGIEKFIDTPVKRYSSGMYVRLAFAVAAHLEPDILIVDEVLAVGDADFQKKCLGKMQEVSHSSERTVIFVSHNLQAVSNLCNNALWLQQGKIKELGRTYNVVNKYLGSIHPDKIEQSWDKPENAPGNDLVKLKSIEIKPQSPELNSFITVATPIQLNFEFWNYLEDGIININLKLCTNTGECVFDLGSPSIKAEKGILELNSIIPGNLLNNTIYTTTLTVVKNYSQHICLFYNCALFEVEDVRENMHYFGEWPGIIRPQINSSFYFKDLIYNDKPI